MDYSMIALDLPYCQQLATLNQQLLEDEGNSQQLSQHYLAQRMHKWLSQDDYFGYACQLPSQQIVAYLLACYQDDYVYIRQLVTERQYRKRGLASALFAQIENKTQAGKQIRLDVLVSNKNAMFFYARQGFKPFYMNMIKNT